MKNFKTPILIKKNSLKLFIFSPFLNIQGVEMAQLAFGLMQTKFGTPLF